MTGEDRNETALAAYLRWLSENRSLDGVILREPQSPPKFTKLLAGTPSAIAQDRDGRSWPISVQLVPTVVSENQRFGLRSAVQKLAERQTDYLEKTAGGSWTIKPYSTLHYAGLNIMRLHGYENMDFIFYDSVTASILVVPLQLDMLFLWANIESAKDYIQQGTAFFSRKIN